MVRLARSGSLALIACFVAFMVWIIATAGINLPFDDEWFDGKGPYLATRVVEGGFTLSDLFVPNNTHRIVPTLTLTVLNTILFRYDLRVEMIASGSLTFLNFVIMAAIWRRTVGDRPVIGQWLSLIILAAMAFSIRQYENWTWGFMNSWFWVSFFMLCGVYLIQRNQPSWRLLALVIVLAFVAQFSLGAGILSWGIFAAMLWIQGERSALRWVVFIVCAAIGAYFLLSIPNVQAGLSGTVDTFAPLSFPERISRWVGYALAFIGSVFTGSGWDSVPQATTFGIVGVLMFVVMVLYLWRRGVTFREMSPWLGIALFGLGSAVLTAVGRERWLDNITPLPVNLRYTPHALYVWLGVIGACSLIFSKPRRRIAPQFVRLVRYVAMIVLVAIGTLQFRVSVAATQALNDRDPNLLLCPYVYVLSGNTQCLADLIFNGDKEMVQGQMDNLLKYQLSAYSQPPSQPIPLNDLMISGDLVTIPSNLPFTYDWQVNAVLPKGCQSQTDVQLVVQSFEGLPQVLASDTISSQADDATFRVPLSEFKGSTIRLTIEAASSESVCVTGLILSQFMLIH